MMIMMMTMMLMMMKMKMAANSVSWGGDREFDDDEDGGEQWEVGVKI